MEVKDVCIPKVMLRTTRLSTQYARVLTRPALRTSSSPQSLTVKRYNSSVQWTEEEQPKKGFSFSRTLLIFTLLGTASYSGAIYYAMKNEAFRDTFTTYVFGAEEVLDYIDSLEKNDNLQKAKEQAVSVTTSTSKIGEKVKEITSGAAAKIKRPEADKGVGKRPIQQSSDGLAKAPIEYTKAEKELTGGSAAIKTLEVTMEPILVNIGNAIDELASIIKDSGLVTEGDKFIQTTRNELAALNKQFETLKAEGHTNVEAALRDQMMQVKEHIAAFSRQTLDTVAKHEEQLKQAADERLNSELLKQRESYAEELTNALVAQAANIHRWWTRDLKYRVENERAGRLAKLDQINARLRGLERIAMDNSERLDQSVQAHQIWVALRALQDAMTGPHKTPFADEIKTLRHLNVTNPLVQTVLDSIPETVSKQGVEPLSHLTEKFQVLSDEIRKVSLVPEDGGFMSHLMSLVASKFMFRKHGLVPGDDVEAVLARVEWYLKEGDLDTAARQLNQLKGWPKKLASDWLDDARRHLEVKQAIEILEAEAGVSSLSQS